VASFIGVLISKVQSAAYRAYVSPLKSASEQSYLPHAQTDPRFLGKESFRNPEKIEKASDGRNIVMRSFVKREKCQWGATSGRGPGSSGAIPTQRYQGSRTSAAARLPVERLRLRGRNKVADRGVEVPENLLDRPAQRFIELGVRLIAKSGALDGVIVEATMRALVDAVLEGCPEAVVGGARRDRQVPREASFSKGGEPASSLQRPSRRLSAPSSAIIRRRADICARQPFLRVWLSPRTTNPGRQQDRRSAALHHPANEGWPRA
jgi:hypothetical protein